MTIEEALESLEVANYTDMHGDIHDLRKGLRRVQSGESSLTDVLHDYRVAATGVIDDSGDVERIISSLESSTPGATMTNEEIAMLADQYATRLEEAASRIAVRMAKAYADASLEEIAKASFLLGWNSAEKYHEEERKLAQCEGSTINSTDDDVTSVSAALADAAHAGGLSTAYYRSADEALRRLAERLRVAQNSLEMVCEKSNEHPCGRCPGCQLADELEGDPTGVPT